MKSKLERKLDKIANMSQDEFRRQTEDSKEKIRTADKLMGIACEIQELLDKAKRIVRKENGQIEARARAYWIPRIEMALTNDHEWLGKCDSMQDTADEIRGFKME